MDSDGSGGRDGGFESLLEALGRAKREVGIAVSHGVKGVQNWVEERWLPVQLVMAGGFSWALGRTFGWLLRRVAELRNWLTSSVVEIALSTSFSAQILLLFFLVYAVHSGIQTRLILVTKTKVGSMDSKRRSEVRADGGGSEDFSSRLIAIGGLFAGILLGSSFGMDGAFVGTGVGWVLGDEFDRRLEAKVNGAGYTPRGEQTHVETREEV